MNWLQRLNLARNICIHLFCTVVFLLACLFLWNAWIGSSLSGLPDYDYLGDVIRLRDSGHPGEALAIAKFVEGEPGMPHREEILGVARGIEEQNRNWFGRAKRFSVGFFAGDMDSTEALVGTVISDFLFIGDARDFGKESYKGLTGQEYDKLVLTLSSVGLVATAASWFDPEPDTKVAAISSRPILTTLKALKRVNALTAKFTLTLLNIGSEVERTKKLGRFTEILEGMGSLMIHSPSGTIATASKEIETVEDLQLVAKWTKSAPTKTITALQVGGDEAVDWMKRSGDFADRQLGKILRKGARGFSKVRTYSRLGKFIFRGRIDQVLRALIDWLMEHPALRPVIFGLLILAALLSFLFGTSTFNKAVLLFGYQKSPIPPPVVPIA